MPWMVFGLRAECCTVSSAERVWRPGVVQGSGHSQDVKEASDEEVNDDKRGGSEKKRKEVRAFLNCYLAS